MSWEIVKGLEGHHHVIPQDDLRPHRRSINCWCHPVVDSVSVGVIVHNAMDLREQFEEGKGQ